MLFVLNFILFIILLSHPEKLMIVRLYVYAPIKGYMHHLYLYMRIFIEKESFERHVPGVGQLVGTVFPGLPSLNNICL